MNNKTTQLVVGSFELDQHQIKRYGVKGAWRSAIQRDCDWRCIDAYGHVNNVIYLDWCQEARSRHFAQVAGHFPGQGGIGVVVRAVEFNYHKPMLLGEQALITSRLKRIGNSSFVQEYAIWNGELCGEGAATCVFYDVQAGIKVVPSQALRDAMVAREPLLGSLVGLQVEEADR
jgi:acyl-CoA thioester hydrolase